MDLHDKVVEWLILIGVWIGVWLEWQTLQEKRRQKIKRIVSSLWKSLKTRQGVSR